MSRHPMRVISGRNRLFCWTLVGLASATTIAKAGDWPQILGPHRNGQADDEILAAWPDSGPKQLWTFQLGSGFAGPAVVGKRVFVFHRVGGDERVQALDAETGESLWKTDFTANYRGGVNPDNGPRCVPVISGNRVFVFGAAGDLHCVDSETGRPQWSRSPSIEYKSPESYFGVGSTPIVIDDRVLVNVGGRDNAGIVAFSASDGKTLWKSTSDSASYSSPAVLPVNGKPHILFIARLNAYCVNPTNGEVVFQFPFGNRGPTVNAAMPLVFDRHFFVSASYGIGAHVSAVEGAKPKTLWANDDSLSSQYSSAVFHRDHLFGTHGREDAGTASLRCVNALSGKVAWEVSEFGVAHVICASDLLLVLTVDGRLVLAEAASKQFKQLASSRVSQGLTRALPALSRGKIYLRENQGQSGSLKCFIVGASR